MDAAVLAERTRSGDHCAWQYGNSGPRSQPGAFDFVSKLLDLSGLRKLVASAIVELSGSQDTDTQRIRPALGMSAAMQDLRDMIARVARSQAPVHIFGESGTGKELVAKLIHEIGSRRDGPLFCFNENAVIYSDVLTRSSACNASIFTSPWKI